MRRRWRRFPVLLGGLLLDAQLFPHRPIQVPVVAFWGVGGSLKRSIILAARRIQTLSHNKQSFTIMSIFMPKGCRIALRFVSRLCSSRSRSASRATHRGILPQLMLVRARQPFFKVQQTSRKAFPPPQPKRGAPIV
jgi:hypothetical protein